MKNERGITISRAAASLHGMHKVSSAELDKIHRELVRTLFDVLLPMPPGPQNVLDVFAAPHYWANHDRIGSPGRKTSSGSSSGAN